MILTIEELRSFITTNETDAVLEALLQALELSIRAYTNNNFQARGYRRKADIIGGIFVTDSDVPFAEEDTIQITESNLIDQRLLTVATVEGEYFTVLEDVPDENDILVTKIVYPMDIKMGVTNMIKWELNNRDKVGIASESISRHSVTYFDMKGDNSVIGYPKVLTGFLMPYKRARFGRGK